MSYRLKKKESLAKGFRRIAHEQLDRTIDRIRHSRFANHRGEAIHGARKGLKQLRALLRLVHGRLPRAFFKRENRAFRDAARLLSAQRDADVQMRTMDRLQKQFDTEARGPLLHPIKRVLRGDVRRVYANAQSRGRPVQAIESLKKVRQRLKKWPWGNLEWRDAWTGLKRTYKQGLKRLQNVQKRTGSEELHEWRRHVKDLWYHLRLLKTASPDLVRSFAEQAEWLGGYLGDDHDLAVLRETILRTANSNQADAATRATLVLIDSRRRQLQRAAKDLGKRLYKEKPAAFVKRIQLQS